jgi:hypothetical protein
VTRIVANSWFKVLALLFPLCGCDAEDPAAERSGEPDECVPVAEGGCVRLLECSDGSTRIVDLCGERSEEAPRDGVPAGPSALGDAPVDPLEVMLCFVEEYKCRPTNTDGYPTRATCEADCPGICTREVGGVPCYGTLPK